MMEPYYKVTNKKILCCSLARLSSLVEYCLHACIRPGWKGMTRKNNQAYFISSLKKKKTFFHHFISDSTHSIREWPTKKLYMTFKRECQCQTTFFLCQWITNSSHSTCELLRKKFYDMCNKSQNLFPLPLGHLKQL